MMIHNRQILVIVNGQTQIIVGTFS